MTPTSSSATCACRKPAASRSIASSLGERPALARRFVLVTGDMIGARAESRACRRIERPQILEKPFSTLDVRGVLAAVNDQVGWRVQET